MSSRAQEKKLARSSHVLEIVWTPHPEYRGSFALIAGAQVCSRHTSCAHVLGPMKPGLLWADGQHPWTEIKLEFLIHRGLARARGRQKMFPLEAISQRLVLAWPDSSCPKKLLISLRFSLERSQFQSATLSSSGCGPGCPGQLCMEGTESFWGCPQTRASRPVHQGGSGRMETSNSLFPALQS